MHSWKLLVHSFASVSILAGLSTVALLGGCRTRSFSDVSESNAAVSNAVAPILKQKFASPIRSGLLPIHVKVDPFAWLALPSAREKAKPLAANHPAQLHLSDFVNEVHSALSARFPEVRSIPPPQVVVLQKKQLNAYTIPAAYCIPLKIVPKGFSPQAADNGKWISFMAGHFLGTPGEGAQSECPKDVALRPDLANSLIAAINKSQPACPMVRSGDHFAIEGVLPSASCSKAPIPDNVSYSGTLVYAAGNAIFVYSGLLKSSEERHVETTLAHELAHYYLAHGHIVPYPFAQKENLLNYFFRITAYGNRSVRPMPDNSPEILSLQQELVDAGMEVEVVIPGMKLHKSAILNTAMIFDSTVELTFLPQGLANSMRSACVPFKVELENLKNYTRTTNATGRGGRWERDPLNAKKVDGMAQRCVNAMSGFTFAELYNWAKAAGEDGEFSYYGQYQMEILAVTLNNEQTFPANSRLGDLIMSYSSKRFATENKARQLAKRAQDLGLGWYTFENEADQMSVHLLAITNRVPSAALEGFFVYAGKVEDAIADDAAYAPSLSDCRKAYLSDWKHWLFRNQAWVPYFGNFENPHPSLCFRVYDVDMESRLFSSIFAGREPLRNSVRWQNLQRQLTSE